MSKQITRIILCIGNFRDVHNAHYTWLYNQEALEKEGFCCFDTTNICICNPYNNTENKELLLRTQSNIEKNFANAHTLLIFSGSYTINPELIIPNVKQLKCLFPKATISAFYALAPRQYARRALLLWQTLNTQTSLLQGQQRLGCPVNAPTSDAIATLRRLLPSQHIALHAHIGTDRSEQEALQIFYQFCGIAINTSKYINYNVPESFFDTEKLAYKEEHLSSTERYHIWYANSLQVPSSAMPFQLFATQSIAKQFAQASQKDSANLKKLMQLPKGWSDTIEDSVIKIDDFCINEQVYQDFCSDISIVHCKQIYEKLTHTPVHFLTLPERFIYKVCSTHLNNKYEPHILPWENATLSVLTPTCNHKDFIARNIESIAAQQLTVPFIHIIADDNSTDGTQEIILEYARKYPHIVPLFKNSATADAADNYYNLFSHARTPFVAICDGDDYVTSPLKLQKQLDFLMANPSYSMCFHPVQVTYENNTKAQRVYPSQEQLPRGIQDKYYLADLLKSNFIQTNSVMYRWRFKDGLPPWFTTRLAPGDWYWHLLHAELGHIGFMNEVMAVYHRHTNAYYFSAENTHSSVAHRLKHGLAELNVYATINEHFCEKYMRYLEPLILGVYSDFLRHYQKSGDDSLLQQAISTYPAFGQRFLAYLKTL